MDKRFLKKLQEENEAFEVIRNELPFPASDLIEEIAPLLDDYFEGIFELDEKAITATFPNGQKFRIIAEEIKK